jgi:hypothetical protein
MIEKQSSLIASGGLGDNATDSFDIYREESTRVAIQAMCRWNRDVASPACGSFDRAWWGWKARDFSDATLQAAMTLLIKEAQANDWGWLMKELLPQYVAFIEKLQHSDGSFDQCYPNERTPGVFYDILPTLLVVHDSPWLDSSARQRIERIIESGLNFALSVDEVHGEIANHLAHFSYGLLMHWQIFGDSRSRLKAESYIARILRNFDEEEGWFQEYHGPDAGYQTRTLAYLTKAAEILNDEKLWDICAQAARFVELMMMPDGSLHPMLGVRSTALIYPSGFERLAARDSSFQSLAKRIREAWSSNRVPLPSQLDFDNALRLGEDAWHAADLALENFHSAGLALNITTQEKIPRDGVTHLPHAGILIRRDANMVSWCAWRLGGVLVVWKSLENDRWQPAHEDGGYLLDGGGAGLWLTRMPDAGQLLELQPNSLVVEVKFNRVMHEDLTPSKLLLLRLLNLTLLRSQWLGDIFRKLVVRRLAGKGSSLPVKMLRKVSFEANSLQVVDSFHNGTSIPKSLAIAPLFRCRRITGNHMASALYFQPLEAVPLGPWAELQSQNMGCDPTFRFEISGVKL